LGGIEVLKKIIAIRETTSDGVALDISVRDGNFSIRARLASKLQKVKDCRNIRSLNLKGQKEVDLGILKTIFSKFPRLQHLNLAGTAAGNIFLSRNITVLTVFEKEEKLIFKGKEQTSEEIVAKLQASKNSDEIRLLSLKGHPNVDLSVLRRVFRKFPHLKYLNLAGTAAGNVFE
jgi:hypothetical protein